MMGGCQRRISSATVLAAWDVLVGRFRLRGRTVLIYASAALLLAAVYGVGLFLQVWRPIDAQARALFLRYVESGPIKVNADLLTCSVEELDGSLSQNDISNAVECSAPILHSPRRLIIDVYFGRRDQVEYWDVREPQQ
jgi:hypothetical protein